MKNKGIKGLALMAIAGVMTTGCDLIKELDYTVTPDPLEMHGDSVRVKVSIKFPEKGINKKAYAEITPMLGETALKPITVVGEKATANGTVVQYKTGGTVVYEDVVAYNSDMKVSSLDVTGKVFKGDKEKGDIEKTKIADATIVTPLLVNKDFRVIYAADKFVRVTEQNYKAAINFLKGRSEVRSGELKDQDILDLGAWLAEEQMNPKLKLKSINLTGFASIEGEVAKNGNLSTDRATAAKAAIMKMAAGKKVANETAQTDAGYSVAGSGEDFDGFKAALETATDISDSDKQLVLRILETIKDPSQREQEIRNLGKTFTTLDKNVFPKQRRTEINVVYDKTGFSDEELKALSKSNIDTLTVEEILFTATLTDDLNEKLRLYKESARLFPNDYRTHNNIGAVLYMQNKMAEAKTAFEKANNTEENVISLNNLAAIAGASGDRSKAKALIAGATGAGKEVDYNKGILAIQDGAYDTAVSNFGSESTYNKALAQLLNENEAAAVSTVNASADNETARGYYLKAIAGARKDNLGDIIDNLKKAFAQDGAYKKMASEDREFMKYLDNASFTAIVK
jgi:tetratricopeptide (TPR) repeat protein